MSAVACYEECIVGGEEGPEVWETVFCAFVAVSTVVD